MFKRSDIKRYTRQILAIIEKNLYLDLHVKSKLFFRFINPVIQLLVLIFVFGVIFNIREGFNLGYWNSGNYVLFLLLAFCIQFSRSIIGKYTELFLAEKYWKTLSGVIIAPVHRFTLLFGTLMSEIILNSIPIGILLVIAFILFPTSLISVFLVILVLIAIFVVFGSIGLIIGVFAISREGYVPYLNIALRLLFLVSCVNYPKEIFPQYVQYFISINPLFYLFEFLRLAWYLGIDYDTSIKYISPIHIVVVLTMVIMAPIVSALLFEKVYNKYGITGY